MRHEASVADAIESTTEQAVKRASQPAPNIPSHARGAWSGWTVRGPAPRQRDSEAGVGAGAGGRIRHLALDWTASVPHAGRHTLNLCGPARGTVVQQSGALPSNAAPATPNRRQTRPDPRLADPHARHGTSDGADGGRAPLAGPPGLRTGPAARFTADND